MTTNRSTRTAATNAVGVILAGGQSTRMGTDKAALRLGDETLLARASRLLQAAGCNKIFLSGHRRDDWSGKAIPDESPGAGPVGGIISALLWAAANLPPDACLLFVPVDAPLLTPALLTAMLESVSDDGCLISGSPLPVALRTSQPVLRQCATMNEELRTARSCSVRRFVEPLSMSRIKPDEAKQLQLVNVNTPAQWEGLLREFENRT